MRGQQPAWRSPGPAPGGADVGGSWRLFRGLRLNLALLVAALFLVFYLLTAVLIYSLTAQLSQQNVDSILQDTTRPLAARVLKDLDQGIFPSEFIALAKLSETYPKVSAIVLRDAQGNAIASTAPAVTRSLAYAATGPAQQLTTERLGGSGWYRVLTLRLESPYHQTLGYLQMTLNVDRDRTSLARLAEVLYLVGGLGIVLAAAAGFFLSRLSLRPAVRAWQQQERFVADASHELRTPLAVMQLNLELVQSRPEATVGENEAWLASIGEEIERLRRLSDQLLTLARTGNDAAAARRERVDLATLVGKAVGAFRPAAEAKGLELRYVPDDSGSPQAGSQVLGDGDSLHQLVAILLDNAVKYTQTGGIDVAFGRLQHEVQLKVRDTGIGIEPQHLGRIFDRFYRADAARAKASGGAGLGLAIAQAIAQEHRGSITAESVPGQGTVFTVVLPAAPR